MTTTTDARWQLAAAIAAEVDKVRQRPDLYPWPRNFVDANVMPLIDAYLSEHLTEQREDIAKAIAERAPFIAASAGEQWERDMLLWAARIARDFDKAVAS